jgi:hypothetical protein
VLTIALAYTAEHFDPIHRLISSVVEHLENPEGRRFDSYISHQMEVCSVVEHWTSNPTVTGSTPVLPNNPALGMGTSIPTSQTVREQSQDGSSPLFFALRCWCSAIAHRLAVNDRSSLRFLRDRTHPSQKYVLLGLHPCCFE